MNRNFRSNPTIIKGQSTSNNPMWVRKCFRIINNHEPPLSLKIFRNVYGASRQPTSYPYYQIIICLRSYRVFIKYCVFSLKCCDFSELCFWCSADVWPAIVSSVYTLTPRGNRVRSETGKYFKIFEKTQYLINTLYLTALFRPLFCKLFSARHNSSPICKLIIKMIFCS